MNIEEVKRAVSMPDLARQYGLKVNRSGFAVCPFHNEKTASMKIYRDSYHCFGCGAHGDQIDFVMRMDGCTFRDAVKKLGGGEAMLSDAERARIIRRKNAAEQKAKEEAKLKEEFFQACHELRVLEYMRSVCEVGGPGWVYSVNKIPMASGRADELLEKLL